MAIGLRENEDGLWLKLRGRSLVLLVSFASGGGLLAGLGLVPSDGDEVDRRLLQCERSEERLAGQIDRQRQFTSDLLTLPGAEGVSALHGMYVPATAGGGK